MKSFKNLGLIQPLLNVIQEMGFNEPTEIQEQAIPFLLEKNRDFIGLAQTGTGKTAAFGLPLLQQIDPNDKRTQALILAPTRELGQQIAHQLNTFSKHLQKVNVLPVYGGASISGQLKDLRKPQHVIIATPGRLIDLIHRKAIKLDSLRYLILDEADEMLNMGFKEDLDKILSYTPADKSTWLFSATMPKEMTGIVARYMDNPRKVSVGSGNEVNENIDHQYVMVDRTDKLESLVRFLTSDPEMRGLVFCRTKRGTQKLADQLSARDFRSDALHGDMSQNQRDKVMQKFKNHELQILVATDVAARGIHVNDLTHVFHFSLPDDISYYTHRSGRTARAGKKGVSLSFITNSDRSLMNRIKKQLNIDFTLVEVPKMTDIANVQLENWCLEVLQSKPNQNVQNAWIEKAEMLFGNLSKEELIAKLVSFQMNSLSTKDHRDDLNVEESHNPGRKHRNKKRNKGGKSYGRNRKRGKKYSKKKSHA